MLPPSQPDDVRQAATTLFLSGLQGLLAGDAERWVNMWAEDGTMEFPFAPEGLPRRLENKAAIRAHMRSLSGTLAFTRFSEPVIHQTLEPTVMLVEFSCEGRAVATGKPYHQDYVAVITTRDGLIQNYRDYWNPLVVQAALR